MHKIEERVQNLQKLADLARKLVRAEETAYEHARHTRDALHTRTSELSRAVSQGRYDGDLYRWAASRKHGMQAELARAERHLVAQARRLTLARRRTEKLETELRRDTGKAGRLRDAECVDDMLHRAIATRRISHR